jgi:hypothetical protein
MKGLIVKRSSLTCQGEHVIIYKKYSVTGTKVKKLNKTQQNPIKPKKTH